MVHIQILCVGKLKEMFYSAACAEYTKRLMSHCKLTITELTEERLPENPSDAQIQSALLQEANTILRKIPKLAKVVTLCVEGTNMSSEQLAGQLDRWTVNGTSHLCFVIGGSYGLHPSVKERSALRLSMSHMIFPHHLARVMVLEQIYRAFQINKGTRYHK